MLRIHFTSTDLGRIRVGRALDPMWETVLSVHQLLQPQPYFTSWSRLARRRLAAAGLTGDTHLLAALAPVSAYFPDFMTPAGHTTSFAAGVETVLSTGKPRLRAEVGQLAAEPAGAPGWLADIAAGRPAALRRLGGVMRRYHDVVLAPYAAEAAALAARNVAEHTEHSLSRGIEAVLTGLGPTARWQSPVLEVDYPLDRDVHLDGRGLHLIPSFFGVNHPITLADPTLRPVLVYPVSREASWRPGSNRTPTDALAELLGETRARVLRLLNAELTTSALAQLASTSASTVSRHTAALRHSGLVSTRRDGGCVLHTRTALGSALIQAR
ncbi:ArsR/SmtB family transcription factor [Streptomyces boninensis]|uniref:ArsR/SmtB family transcription factor n=1 Tax=Streptomyces boninensis TaxID=2039455 RepID=UPI003B22175A